MVIRLVVTGKRIVEMWYVKSGGGLETAPNIKKSSHFIRKRNLTNNKGPLISCKTSVNMAFGVTISLDITLVYLCEIYISKLSL